ncbi:very short patch repair endonuclease [Burkholderia cepacia]|uniref:very short patch repair endonuclease n=1 Tax=Burkholderia cepacia TaxID=292 RepID=UPI0026524BC2|nr:very short patch repair endonuclease [Burkholderia cepacia]MDN7915350.1 very short patch repair endonuclease [Burkholderia cepacia]
MDKVSPEVRSRMMGRISGKDTQPELIVRRTAHALGFRFRLHRRDLPGRPDVVFPGKKTVIFVHGCFWHRHKGCKYCYTPKSNVEFWQEKFENNVGRDERVRKKLEDLGWKVAVIWECETADLPNLRTKLQAYLIHDRCS